MDLFIYIINLSSTVEEEIYVFVWILKLKKRSKMFTNVLFKMRFRFFFIFSPLPFNANKEQFCNTIDIFYLIAYSQFGWIQFDHHDVNRFSTINTSILSSLASTNLVECGAYFRTKFCIPVSAHPFPYPFLLTPPTSSTRQKNRKKKN